MARRRRDGVRIGGSVNAPQPILPAAAVRSMSMSRNRRSRKTRTYRGRFVCPTRVVPLLFDEMRLLSPHPADSEAICDGYEGRRPGTATNRLRDAPAASGSSRRTKADVGARDLHHAWRVGRRPRCCSVSKRVTCQQCSPHRQRPLADKRGSGGSLPALVMRPTIECSRR